MSNIFRIDMLPGREGDCLWIEYGDENAPHRILIDGGRQIAYETVRARFDALPDDQREFDLALLTHVDADHIEGFLKLLGDTERGVTFRDFWFNGFHHLDKESFVPLDENSDEESFGAVQGETLTKGLIDQKWPWNKLFGNGPVVVPDDGELPFRTLEGGMKLTVLSPTWKGLEKMQTRWVKEVKKAGLVPGAHVQDDEEEDDDDESFGPLDEDEVNELAELNPKKDTSPANGSSIAVMAEFSGKRVLLTGDAHFNVLEKSLPRFSGFEDGSVAVDAFKVSHHGSRKTISNELVKLATSPLYLVSTNGSRHKHPDREALARVVSFGPDNKELVFNYRTDFTKVWDDCALKNAFSYSTRFPDAGHDGMIRVELL